MSNEHHHHETFDVLTSADGTDVLTLTLSCATPLEHYTRTTTRHGDGADDVCSTGLRVYEGGQLLAAFVAQYGACLLPRRSGDGGSRAHTQPQRCRRVLELGCGCALVGFTAARTLPHTRVVFTDAAVDCLAHVRASAAAMGVTVCDAANDGNSNNSNSSNNTSDVAAVTVTAAHCTYPLRWCDASVDALLHALRQQEQQEQDEQQQQEQQPVSLDMLVGSDLMYYRVDMNALLRACVRLLLQPSPSCGPAATTMAAGDVRATMPFVVFAHAMRVAGGRVALARTARGLGFAIAAVALDAFVGTAVVQRMGWGSMELVLLLLQQQQSLPRHHRRDERDAEDDDDDDDDVVMLHDVRVVREALMRRCCQPCTATHTCDGDTSRCAACTRATQRTTALCARVMCYPCMDGRAAHMQGCTDAHADANDDADALLHVLL